MIFFFFFSGCLCLFKLLQLSLFVVLFQRETSPKARLPVKQRGFYCDDAPPAPKKSLLLDMSFLLWDSVVAESINWTVSEFQV